MHADPRVEDWSNLLRDWARQVGDNPDRIAELIVSELNSEED